MLQNPRGLLRQGYTEQAEALADLRRYLLQGVLYALRRRRGSLAHLSAADIEALAEDCAQDALIEGAAFEVTLTEVGVYDYFCLPHEMAGMVGRIVVRHAVGPGSRAFDYFRGQPGTSMWLPVPPEARKTFPSVAQILQQRVVRLR